MKFSYGIRIALTDGTFARVWGGVGDLVVPLDVVETAPALYLGGGPLVNVPDFQDLINGAADRLTLVVSGVSVSTIAMATTEAQAMRGATLYIARFDFNDDWSLADVEYEATFRCDSLTTASQQDDQGRTRSITLSIGTENTNRSRAPLAFFTDADQRQRSPTDTIFDHVAGISAGTSRRFGPV